MYNVYNKNDFKVKDIIICTNGSHEGLIGIITDIRKDDDKESLNDCIDIYCSFETTYEIIIDNVPIKTTYIANDILLNENCIKKI